MLETKEVGWGGAEGVREDAGICARLSACVHKRRSGPNCPSISTQLFYGQGVSVCESGWICECVCVCMGSQYLTCVLGYEWATAID